ncbi:hypothetical protein [Hyphococcus luteus]|uniref:Uncharacterized protein n=1 Tax=Hyphococcus luteus TaxID=2058213 RepID=A0A2S7K8W8_9PROT|nr:hypothetical protein [Marinicaulis flavus]PQA88928.1 hypothetical protein CW354_02970 [Marinicaulis flavus]
MLGRIIRLLTLPFRVVGRFVKRGAGDAKAAGRTAANAGGSIIASAAGADILEEEYREEPPSGVETFLFKQLPRPRLTEKAASELSLEQAAGYASDARAFYRYGFPIFARGDFFYEEVEQEYLNAALGFDRNSIDRRFLEVTTLFRRTLNNNTRRMLLIWTPALYLLVFGAGVLLLQSGAGAALPDSAAQIGGAPAAIFAAAALVGVFLAFLVYSWPYKVVQQRNLMNLDNYITSKFARINNNFQVAKRRALNVERDKRMAQREELKDEAGSWTLAYHWFAMRLFLCELALRNKFYQVRRNTTLYWAGGLFLTSIAIAGLAALLFVKGASLQTLGFFAGASLVYLALIGAVMRGATGMMFRVVESNEWSRFHIVDLDATIRDHVGEDKLQIVTFRDRNRME